MNLSEVHIDFSNKFLLAIPWHKDGMCKHIYPEGGSLAVFWVVFTRKSIKTQKQCPEDKVDLRDRSRYGEG